MDEIIGVPIIPTASGFVMSSTTTSASSAAPRPVEGTPEFMSWATGGTVTMRPGTAFVASVSESEPVIEKRCANCNRRLGEGDNTCADDHCEDHSRWVLRVALTAEQLAKREETKGAAVLKKELAELEKGMYNRAELKKLAMLSTKLFTERFYAEPEEKPDPYLVKLYTCARKYSGDNNDFFELVELITKTKRPPSIMETLTFPALCVVVPIGTNLNGHNYRMNEPIMAVSTNKDLFMSMGGHTGNHLTRRRMGLRPATEAEIDVWINTASLSTIEYMLKQVHL